MEGLLHVNEEQTRGRTLVNDDARGRKRSARAYAPASITGFFAIHEHHDPLQKGSFGCGLVLESGCVTEIAQVPTRAAESRILINGRAEEAPTTRYVLDRLAAYAPVNVNTRFDVPIGCGFGASAAGALSTALALNELLTLSLSLNKLAQIAHCAEVANSTGLGDVIAEACGGVVIRKQPGPPGIGVIDRIPHRNEQVSYVTFGVKLTKSVLAEGGEATKRRINDAGKVALQAVLRKPTLETLMHASREFALQIELISTTCKDAIEAVAAEGKVASVAMLGETVFVIGGSDALREFGAVKTSRLSHVGAHLL
ncbi:MAG: pantoate kinase [Candidatus Methanospirareceae archaeon]